MADAFSESQYTESDTAVDLQTVYDECLTVYPDGKED